MKTKKLLVVVDMQYDFVIPGGKLYVPGAETLIVPITQAIGAFKTDDVIYTQDSHEKWSYHTTEEYKTYGFPPHCLRGEIGRQIVVPTRNSRVFQKNEFDVWKGKWNAPGLTHRAKEYDEIVICGVAADFCVADAYHGFKMLNDNTHVLGDLTLGIKSNPFK